MKRAKLFVLWIVLAQLGKLKVQLLLTQLFQSFRDLRFTIAPKLHLDLLWYEESNLALLNQNRQLLEFLKILAGEVIEGEEDVRVDEEIR